MSTPNADAWAIFIDGTDRTDNVSSDEISVVTKAHAQTGVLDAVIRDEAGTLPIATDQDVVLLGRVMTGAATTMAASSIVGATNIKVTAVTGMAAGDILVIGEHPNAEHRTISIVGTAGSGGTGVTISPALSIAHGNGDQVYEAERLFGGTIRRRVGATYGGTKYHTITARDYTDLLGQDVIDVAFRSVVESDKARVTWLITNWGFKGVTAGTEVIQTLASMPLGEDGTPEQDFSGKSLQVALEQIEAITGASHYVDFHKRLHYFLTESNAAPFALSDSPNMSTTFPYRDFSLPEDSVDKVNAVYVYGGVVNGAQVKGWRPNPPPAAAGRVAAVIRDETITSTAELNAVGDAYLAGHSAVMQDGTLVTTRTGFRAGQTVQITNSDWGLAAASRYIQQVTMKIVGLTPVFTIEFGSKPDTLTNSIGGAVSLGEKALAVAINAPTAAIAAVSDLSVGGANMVPNSSAESQATQGWTVGSGWVWSYDPVSPEEAYAGSQVARLAPAGAAAAALTTPLIAVDRLDDWWISYWSFLRSRSSGSVKAEVLEYDAASTLLATTPIPSPGSTVESLWTRHSFHLGPNAEFGRTAFQATTAFIRLSFDDASTGTFVWDVDGIQVERGRLITAYAPAPSELVDGQIIGTNIAGDAITETEIADDSITTPKLATGAVDATKVAANAIVAGKIAAGAVTAENIAASGISADQIKSGQLTLGSLAGYPDVLVVMDADGDEIGRWGSDGLLITDASDSLLKIRMQNGVLEFSPDAGVTWTTAISGYGISADSIKVGTLPGGHNAVPNSGFELASFSSPGTKVWTSQADFAALAGVINATNTAGGSLIMTTTS